jgi:hypothetical protein
VNGPEHYAESERLAVRADHYVHGDGADTAVGHAFAAMAQVHATLALAAATALDPYATTTGNSRHASWVDVAS